MKTKKDATNQNGFSFEESARRGNVDFIFVAFTPSNSSTHSNSAGKDLTSPLPAGGMARAGGAEAGSLNR